VDRLSLFQIDLRMRQWECSLCRVIAWPPASPVLGGAAGTANIAAPPRFFSHPTIATAAADRGSLPSTVLFLLANEP
jgi:hypothetical protein